MKLSIDWLRQWVSLPLESKVLDSKVLADKLTLLGLEVDSVSPASLPFSGIIVAEVVACEQHPNADRLRVTQVDIGSKKIQVVCGAPNVREGLKVPFAQVGAVLPGGLVIKTAKLRGVESFGMLCSASELSFSDDAGGLFELPHDAGLGIDLRSYLKLDDQILDIDLTPNRGDCLSMIGLAREVSVGFSLALNPINVPAPVSLEIPDVFPVQLQAPMACPLYLGRIIRDVDITSQSPVWMKERLRRVGIRSINPVVDVTNYVMLEWGQPMHGFDLNRLSLGIYVRMAEPQEQLVLLDGTTITLTKDILVIADHEKALALAGIMGGEQSSVSVGTTDVFLESAFFNPVFIAGKARRYGLYTESAQRFERGVDFQLAHKAMDYATNYIVSICGGKPGAISEAVDPRHMPKIKTIHLTAARVNDLLGINISDGQIEQILQGLGFSLNLTSCSCWSVTVPSWRFDIEIEEDLIEEVCRVHGYDLLPACLPTTVMQTTSVNESNISDSQLRQSLVNRGYHEVISFSFIDPNISQLFEQKYQAMELSNPISNDMSVMRTSLLPGLTSVFKYNQSRQQQRIRLFEIGQVFIEHNNQSGIDQDFYLAAIISGHRYLDNWQNKAENVNFFDIKGDLQALMGLSGCQDTFEFKLGEKKHGAVHPGQYADVFRSGKYIGIVGALHPEVANAMNIVGNCYMFEVSLKSLQLGSVPVFKKISKYPIVRRDLAFIIEKEMTVSHICTTIKKLAGEWLQQVSVFDVYEGEGVKSGFKSIALSLTLQHISRTLEEEEVNLFLESIIFKMRTDLNAELRT